MKRFGLNLLSSLVLLLVPFISFADVTTAFGGTTGTGTQLQTLFSDFFTFANTVLIPALLGIGFLFFVFGMFRYFIIGGDDEDKRKSGKDLMIYSILGFVLIVIFYGIVNILVNTIGIKDAALNNLPAVDNIE